MQRTLLLSCMRRHRLTHKAHGKNKACTTPEPPLLEICWQNNLNYAEEPWCSTQYVVTVYYLNLSCCSTASWERRGTRRGLAGRGVAALASPGKKPLQSHLTSLLYFKTAGGLGDGKHLSCTSNLPSNHTVFNTLLKPCFLWSFKSLQLL